MKGPHSSNSLRGRRSHTFSTRSLELLVLNRSREDLGRLVKQVMLRFAIHESPDKRDDLLGLTLESFRTVDQKNSACLLNCGPTQVSFCTPSLRTEEGTRISHQYCLWPLQTHGHPEEIVMIVFNFQCIVH